jgi:hypothetical protein
MKATTGRILRRIPRSLQVHDVVIGEPFALQLARVGNARTRAIGIHRRLVRILAAAQVSVL